MNNLQNFAEFMAMVRAQAEDSSEPNTTLSQDEQVEMLEADEMPSCPFEVGTLVTPREGSNLRDRGAPHRVVAVMEPQFVSQGRAGTPWQFGNMLVSMVRGDKILHYFGDSRDYERWYRQR
jgi:hypothetical protein